MKEPIAKQANAVAKDVIREFVEITGHSPAVLFRHSVGLFLLDQIVAGFELDTDSTSASSAELVKSAEDFLATIDGEVVRRAVLLLGAADYELWRAIKFLEEGDDFAIVCFSSAMAHFGAAFELSQRAGVLTETTVNAAKSILGRIGADARHAENRAMKQEVFDWLDVNFSTQKSMDAAAEAIAGKVVPVSFRTARDWVGEWKKLRSTGTP